MITKSHDITEDRMMDAVCMAVDAYGFENLTTKQWAEKANVSEGSLYYHFENKDDLLEKTFLRTDRHFIRELNQIFLEHAGAGSMKKAASQIMNDYLVFLCSHPVEVRFYQAFSKTKLYMGKARDEQSKDWSEMEKVLSLYQLTKQETQTELQFFFTESVNAYAAYLCSFNADKPDDNYKYIGELLVVILTYILEEKK